ncbi:MAG: cysteine desulfurase [Methanoregulaceae archaeon]|nr:cysteine desulfurase [Methanoregulaceae archaeon]
MSRPRIYADHAATTPLLPAAREAMLPWLEAGFGNASSIHSEGRQARAAIDEAREVLSEELGSLFAEVIFTGSGTEAANLALFGSALAAMEAGSPRKRILIGAADHHCVLHTQERLEQFGFIVESIPVDRAARVDLDALEDRLGEDVLLVALLHANNEFGTIAPVREAASLAQRVGAKVFIDAVQTFGTLPVRVDDLGADLLAVSAHKVYGPKGAGALYIRAGTDVSPLVVGGGQEREMRAGTENTAAIVGFSAAVRAFPRLEEQPERFPAAQAFLRELADPACITVPELTTLPGHAHLWFPGISAESLLIRLDREGVSASAGAACSAGSLEPSHVMLAAGFSPIEAKEGVRFSFGQFQSFEDGAEVASRLKRVLADFRRMS